MKITNKFRIISQQWLSENFHFEYSLREKYSREQFLTNFSLGNCVRTLWASSQQTLKLEWKLDSQRKDANSILFSSFAKNTLGNNSRMYSWYRNDTSKGSTKVLVEETTESTGVLVCNRRTVTRLHRESLTERGREDSDSGTTWFSRQRGHSMNERTNERTYYTIRKMLAVVGRR